MMPGRSLLGVIGLGVRRVRGRLTGPTPGRTLVCIGGVTAAIAVLVIVTGLSLGLAGTATVEGDDTDYWLVPEDSDVGSTPFAYEGTRLSGVHEIARDVAEDERVSHATPVALEPIRLDNREASESAYVLAVGVVPAQEPRSILGFDVSRLDSSYPYYADGTYNGTWTGELLASPAAAEVLALESEETLAIGGSQREFTVLDVTEDDPEIGIGEVPVVVVHLAELQSVTGLAQNDQGDQILVSSSDSSIREDIEARYPGMAVTTDGGFDDITPEPTDMPFALAVAAGITSLGLGVIFVATMMGLELTATRTQLAVLKAIGFGPGSLTLLLVTETVTVALLGGVLGAMVGIAGIFALNAGIASALELPAVASADPLLIGYGVGAAVLVGLLSVGYPLVVAYRTDTLEELTR